MTCGCLNEMKSLEKLFDYGFAEDEVLFFGRIPREAVVQVFDSESEQHWGTFS